jgi:hypothetical protein
MGINLHKMIVKVLRAFITRVRQCTFYGISLWLTEVRNLVLNTV